MRLCVNQSSPEERGSLNGWMQCGVLMGRAAMGGGALVLEGWIGFPAVVGILMGLILVSAALLLFAEEKHSADSDSSIQGDAAFFRRLRSMFRELLESCTIRWYMGRADVHADRSGCVQVSGSGDRAISD